MVFHIYFRFKDVEAFIISMDPRPSIISRVEAMKSKNALLVIFKILTQEDPNCYSKNTNGVFFNLAKISDASIAKLMEVLDQLESHQSEYDNTAQELELLKKVLSTKEITAPERELPHPSQAKPPPPTHVAQVPKRRRPPGAVTAKEDNDYDAMMKAHLKPPVYKGVLGRLDKLVRKQRRRRSFHRKSPRWSDHLQGPDAEAEGELDAGCDPDDEGAPEMDFEDIAETGSFEEDLPEDPEVDDPEDAAGDDLEEPEDHAGDDLEDPEDPEDSEDSEGESSEGDVSEDLLTAFAEEKKRKLQSFRDLSSSSSLSNAFPLMVPEDDFDDIAPTT